jgi:hypothetical protein
VIPSCSEPSNANFFNAVLGRSFVISPATQPSAAVSVRLYISEAEFTAYQTTATTGTPSNPNDDAASIGVMGMTKHSNPAVNGDPTNICLTGTNIYVPQTGSGSTGTIFTGFDGSYFIEYSITGFSSMFPMVSASSPLPVTLTSFNASCDDQAVQVRWTTATEYNASHYELESSRDGSHWTNIARIEAAGTTNQTTNYSFTDRSFGTLNYYRLVQVDFDGTSEVFGPISANCNIDNSRMRVYPNPTDRDFTLLIETNDEISNALIELVDLSGRIIQTREIKILSGNTNVPFNTTGMTPGTYIIQIKGENNKFTPVRIVVM